MRRNALFLIIGVMISGLFLSGLVWMTRLQERGWSRDPRVFDGQMTFVVTLLATVISGFLLNHAFNRRRSSEVTSSTSDRRSAGPPLADHPLRDRFLDG